MIDDPFSLPEFGQMTPDAVEAALDRVLAAHRATVAVIVAEAPSDFATAWLPLERANNRLGAVWATLSHLHGVADSPALREAYDQAQRRLVEHAMEVGQNRALYDVLHGVSRAPTFQALAPDDRVALTKSLRDFVRAGVALEPAARQRYSEIAVRLAALSNAFGTAVLEATSAWSEHVTERALLDGVPDADLALLQQAAREVGKEGWIVNLQPYAVNAVMTYARDRGLRQRVYTAYGTRASDQGPQGYAMGGSEDHAGDNGPRMAEIVRLRSELAQIMGHNSAAEFLLEPRMAPDAETVLAYLRDLAARARPSAERDMVQLRAFARDEFGFETLEPWDLGYVSYHLRRRQFAIDDERERAHFPVHRVLAGWRQLLGELFGLRLRPRHDVAVWHPDVVYYEVLEQDGSLIGGVYLDLFARPGKRGGAWMAQARPRLRDLGVATPPVAYLVCNFAPPSEAYPALLRHSDVLTLLHETGHMLHHVLTRIDRPSIAGTNGFEWDAIEMPSQLMEDFGWDERVLAMMSGHYQTGEGLPASLYHAMVKARRFQSGLALLRQVEFSLFDILLHHGDPDAEARAVLEQVRDEVAVSRPPSWHRFANAFTHVFAGGYAAGYYSYLWADLLAADGFQAFAEAGILDRATGQRWRDEVLARGASRPAAESFSAFRGRQAHPSAQLARLGLA